MKSRLAGRQAPYLPPRGALAPEGSSSDRSLADLLKAYLAALATLVTLAGLVSTEAYYQAFGLRYQALGLGAQHFVLRGLTAVFESLWMLIVYLAAVTVLVGDGFIGARFKSYKQLKPVLAAVVMLAFLWAGYFVARESGEKQALQDMVAATSKLPRLLEFQVDPSACGIRCDFEGYRLLLTDSDAVYVLKASTGAGRPALRRFPKAAVKVMEVGGA